MEEAIREIPVLFRWWYDTSAILPEYDDSETGTIPVGTKIKAVETEGDRIVCDLENARKIESTQLEKGRVKRVFLFCRATPLQVEMSLEDWESHTKRV